MLITGYMVGRDEGGACIALVVRDVLPVGCSTGRCHLVRKLNRQDLVQEFVQDGVPSDWLMFPDLPADVVALLENGGELKITDAADDSTISCVIESAAPLKVTGGML
ncbi:MAG: hypothetical protein ITG07_02655 [Candidimonas sp.]|nr:hypothetical protein [Candidimonas sp.]